MSTIPHKKLHNFNFPFLNWGQKHHSTTTTSSRRHRHRHADVAKPEDKLVDVDVASAVVETEVKPWKLRPRKSLNGKVNGNGDGGVNGDGNGGGRRLGMRGGGVVTEVVVEEKKEEEEGENKKKRRLWISLSKDEIEEDVYAFTGAKPNRRPKKRNKIAQKHVDNVSPGLYLCGISADSYRV